MDLCEWSLGQTQDDFVRILCFVEAIAESQDDPDVDCETFAEDCIDDSSNTVDELECEIDPETFGEELPDCASEVTVAELEDCYSAIIGVLQEAADDISCESVPVVDPFQGPCDDLEDRCPDLFD